MTEATLVAGANDSHRDPRHRTWVPARVRFGLSGTLDAEIRNYCRTGFYLAFADMRPPDADALLGETVQLEIPLVGARCDQTAVLTGLVVHCSAAGVGVLAEAMPEAALEALRDAASNAAPPEPAPTGGAVAVPPSRAALLTESVQRQCTGRLREFLDLLVAGFFDLAGERLASAMDDAVSMTVQSNCAFDAQRLARQRTAIEGVFFSSIRNRINRPTVYEVGEKLGPPAEGLALVDASKFEDWLNLSKVIGRLEVEFADALANLDRGYIRLVAAPHDRKTNPFAPEAICRAFQEAIEGLGFSGSVRNLLYRTWGDAFASHAADFYRDLNEALGQPKLVASPLSGAPSSDAPSAPSLHATPLVVGESTACVGDTGTVPEVSASRPAAAEYLPARDRPHRKSGVGSSGARPTADSTRQARATPSPHSPSVRGPVRATPHPPLRAPLLIESLRHSARLLGVTGDDASSPPYSAAAATAPSSSDTAADATPEATLDELLDAIDSLSAPDGGASESGWTDGLAARLAVRLAGAPTGARRLAATTCQHIDAAAGVLGRAAADYGPDSDLRVLLKRLERPLIKLSLRDKDGLGTPGRPARRLVDLLDQYAMAADDRGVLFDASLRQLLVGLVDRLAAVDSADPRLIEETSRSLEKGLPPLRRGRNRRVARIQQVCEGRQRIRTVRAEVDQALERRLAGRAVPDAVLRLIDGGWRQYLMLLAIRQGHQGQEWEQGLGVPERLAVVLARPEDEPAASEQDVDELIQEIERTLSTVSVDRRTLSALVEELQNLATRAAIGEGGGRAPLRLPQARPAPVDAVGATAFADRLQIGEWWDLELDGRLTPMQLVWLSQPPAACAFVNRSATRKLELDLPDLAERFAAGRAKSGNDLDLPLLERSEQTLIDESWQSLLDRALHDPVTGLPNRKGFLRRLERLERDSISEPSSAAQTHTVCIVEFDQFRTIYDRCGVEAAERLACDLAEVVRGHVGSDAVLAAFRDDTLALLFRGCSSRDCRTAAVLLERLKDYRFHHAEHVYGIGLNVGLAELAPPRFGAAEAIRRADSACIAAKSLGRNRIQVYEDSTPELQTLESLMDWAGCIDSFLQGNGLYLRCQRVTPVASDSGLLPYYEVLLGIRSEPGVEIKPMHFIPTVERLNRAHELDLWVMRRVFEWVRVHPSMLDSIASFAINLSATSMGHPEVTTFLREEFPCSGVPTEKIAFEITETAAIESYTAVQQLIREVRRYGCKFALDDFGTGFTSYAHLKNLHTDALKIDGSFVKDMLDNPADQAMVKSMNDIAHSLGLRTVAEYVESPGILDRLREIGVDYAQGYAVHKPCPIDEIVQ